MKPDENQPGFFPRESEAVGESPPLEDRKVRQSASASLSGDSVSRQVGDSTSGNENKPLDDDDDEPSEADEWEAFWDEADKEGLIAVRPQRELAVYPNKWGGIVIRECAPEYGEDDTFIVLSGPGPAYRLIDAIQKQLALLKGEKNERR